MAMVGHGVQRLIGGLGLVVCRAFCVSEKAENGEKSTIRDIRVLL